MTKKWAVKKLVFLYSHFYSVLIVCVGFWEKVIVNKFVAAFKPISEVFYLPLVRSVNGPMLVSVEGYACGPKLIVAGYLCTVFINKAVELAFAKLVILIKIYYLRLYGQIQIHNDSFEFVVVKEIPIK